LGVPEILELLLGLGRGGRGGGRLRCLVLRLPLAGEKGILLVGGCEKEKIFETIQRQNTPRKIPVLLL